MPCMCVSLATRRVSNVSQDKKSKVNVIWQLLNGFQDDFIFIVLEEGRFVLVLGSKVKHKHQNVRYWE